MKMTVLIPTYRRPKDLERCLTALQQQIRPADEVLVTVRDLDAETRTFLATFDPHSLPLRLLTITVPGVVAAINLGFESASGDIISVTDDDAAPHPDWLQRIEAHFLADESLGGLGGRDWLYMNGKLQDATVHPGASSIVGRVQWFGRIIGNHHIGEGAPREVDILKGVNMSFRHSTLANLYCDERMKGTGAQVHFEVGLSLSIKRKGWKLIYDPLVAVDHHLAQRFDEDQRTIAFNYVAASNVAQNETLVLLDHLSFSRRIIFLVWAIFIGTRSTFGLLNLLRFLPTEREIAIQKWLASMHGRWHSLQTWLTTTQSLRPVELNDPIVPENEP
jgi:glycosyltransferase involved in cell wall biosynthesis